MIAHHNTDTAALKLFNQARLFRLLKRIHPVINTVIAVLRKPVNESPVEDMINNSLMILNICPSERIICGSLNIFDTGQICFR